MTDDLSRALDRLEVLPDAEPHELQDCLADLAALENLTPQIARVVLRTWLARLDTLVPPDADRELHATPLKRLQATEVRR